MWTDKLFAAIVNGNINCQWQNWCFRELKLINFWPDKSRLIVFWDTIWKLTFPHIWHISQLEFCTCDPKSCWSCRCNSSCGKLFLWQKLLKTVKSWELQNAYFLYHSHEETNTRIKQVYKFVVSIWLSYSRNKSSLWRLVNICAFAYRVSPLECWTLDHKTAVALNTLVTVGFLG